MSFMDEVLFKSLQNKFLKQAIKLNILENVPRIQIETQKRRSSAEVNSKILSTL